MSESEEEGAKDWSYTSHVRADLRGVDLSGADLREQFSMVQILRVRTFLERICGVLRSSTRIS